MISRDSLLDQIRRLGFSFKERKKRVEIYRKRGSTMRVLVPHHKHFAVPAAASYLRQCGMQEKQIETFLAASRR